MFKRKSQSPEAQIIVIEEKIALAQTELETTQVDANSAYLIAEDTESDAATKQADKARAAVVDAQDRLARLNGALLQARQLEQTACDTATAEQTADAWRSTKRLVDDYMTKAVKIETTLINLSNDYKELEKMSEDLFIIAPVRSGKLRSAGLGNGQIEKSFRLHMVKLGHPWAVQYLWNKADIPAFSDMMKNSVKSVMAFKQEQHNDQ